MSKASKSKRKALAARTARASMTQARRPSRGTSDRSPKLAPPGAPDLVVAAPVDAPPAPASRASVLEEAFFRQGHELHAVTFGHEVHALDDVRPSRHAQPNAVARRARLRRVFAGVMGFASVLTVVVTAKALARHAQAASAPMDTSLILPQVIVASIDLDAPPAEETSSEAAGAPASGSASSGLSGRRARQQPIW